jgi:hypothetical protein
MITLSKMRKIDPSSTVSMDDEQLEKVRQELYEQIQLIYDVWRSQSGSNSPVGSLTIKETELQ